MRKFVLGALMALSFAGTSHARVIDRPYTAGNCHLMSVRGGGVVQEFSCPTTADFWDRIAWQVRQSVNGLRVDTVYQDSRTRRWFVVFGNDRDR